jgi:hypothetical protein
MFIIGARADKELERRRFLSSRLVGCFGLLV